jgi:hypothetical protein
MLALSRTNIQGGGDGQNIEPWIGRPVVVLSVRGTFLEDRDETLLVKPEAGSEGEIPKTNVLAIEESRRWTRPMITFL